MSATSIADRQYRRLWVLYVLIASLFGILVIRLVDLQILKFSYFEAVAASQRQRSSEIVPSRGTIYMADGRDGELFPVASNRPQWIAYAVPREIDDPAEVAERLAPALHDFRQRQQERTKRIIAETGQARLASSAEAAAPDEAAEPPSREQEIDALRDQLHEKLDKRTDPYEPLIRSYEVIDEELKGFLEEADLPGIVVAEQEARVYPENTLAAHILGYLGQDGEGLAGRYGIEEYFNQALAGDAGWLFSEQDVSGRLIGSAGRDFKPPEDGADVVLTVDRVVQSIIEDELKDGVNKFAAERGSIIVMNPQTGAILGAATYPTFDPNYYYSVADASVQTNPIVSDLFEPGSILKPVIMAAGIEEGTVTPHTTFVDSGPIKVADYTINTFDGKHHGVQTMTQVLEQSNNIGMVWLGQQLGAGVMYDYLRRFGLGEQTGVELAGETKNTLRSPEEWNVTTVATTSFGQGVALTPLQALNSINVLANEGLLMQPYIVSHVREQDGQQRLHQPTAVHQVVSSSTAEQLSAMMVSVIENGVATLARVPGYYLAGKTGTAQVPDERGKYSPDRKIISFVGYGPVKDPQFSILVKLDNPAGLSFASGTAAPMFQNVAEKLLNYYQIPPDYDPSSQPPAFAPPRGPEGDGA